jgi:hypothetical protein
MPWPIVAAVAGGLLGGLGSFLGGRSQAKSQDKAIAAQRDQQNRVNTMGQTLFRGGNAPSQYEQMALGMMNGGMPQFASLNPTSVNTLGGNYNLANMLGQMAMPANMSQDGIFQSMNRGPGDLYNAYTQLGQTGNRFDATQMFQSMIGLEDQQMNKALTKARGATGGLGQRLGTGSQRVLGDIASEMALGGAAQRQQLGLNIHEAAAGRSANAMQQLAQMQMGLQQQQNEQAFGAQQFNAQQQAAATQYNNQMGQQGFMNQMNAMQVGSGLAQQRAQNQAQALGIMAGVPTPQANPNAGWMGQGIAGMANAGMDALSMWYLMSNLGKKG